MCIRDRPRVVKVQEALEDFGAKELPSPATFLNYHYPVCGACIQNYCFLSLRFGVGVVITKRTGEQHLTRLRFRGEEGIALVHVTGVALCGAIYDVGVEAGHREVRFVFPDKATFVLLATLMAELNPQLCVSATSDSNRWALLADAQYIPCPYMDVYMPQETYERLETMLREAGEMQEFIQQQLAKFALNGQFISPSKHRPLPCEVVFLSGEKLVMSYDD